MMVMVMMMINISPGGSYLYIAIEPYAINMLRLANVDEDKEPCVVALGE